MRICIHKTTGKIIEAHDRAPDGLLARNAICSGYAMDDIEELEVTAAEYAARVDAAADNLPTNAEIAELDALSLETMRDILAGDDTPINRNRISSLRSVVQALREEMDNA